MWRRLLRAGVLTAIVDGLFSTILTIAFYDSTFARLWQGVASVLLGKDALNGGMRAIAIGLAMHIAVAFFWSAIFLLLWARSQTLQRVTNTMYGIVIIAASYGPLIWLVMSLLVIPTLAHRPPNITVRWWIQLAGHIPFVGLPIVASIARRR
ncbi:MAG: hypothetical protein ACTHQM_09715 [Thermoanaerobaculia bacterium]